MNLRVGSRTPSVCSQSCHRVAGSHQIYGASLKGRKACATPREQGVFKARSQTHVEATRDLLQERRESNGQASTSDPGTMTQGSCSAHPLSAVQTCTTVTLPAQVHLIIKEFSNGLAAAYRLSSLTGSQARKKPGRRSYIIQYFWL